MESSGVSERLPFDERVYFDSRGSRLSPASFFIVTACAFGNWHINATRVSRRSREIVVDRFETCSFKLMAAQPVPSLPARSFAEIL